MPAPTREYKKIDGDTLEVTITYIRIVKRHALEEDKKRFEAEIGVFESDIGRVGKDIVEVNKRLAILNG